MSIWNVANDTSKRERINALLKLQLSTFNPVDLVGENIIKAG